jgi:hypothetical protein
MAQLGRVFFVTTDKDTDFTGALATNAAATANLAVPQLPDSAQCRLKNIGIISDQALSWEVWLWATNSFNDNASDLDAVYPFGRWQFDASNGIQIAGTGPYYYYIDGLDVPYQDSQKLSQLHVMLINRSATSKNAGATGEIVVKFCLEPTLGF